MAGINMLGFFLAQEQGNKKNTIENYTTSYQWRLRKTGLVFWFGLVWFDFLVFAPDLSDLSVFIFC